MSFLPPYTIFTGGVHPILDNHPTILRLIELVIKESGDTPVSLCGELAGRIDVVPSLLRAGLRSFSVPAALVPDIKQAIRNAKETEKSREDG